jgi:hypothetical protein
MTTEAHRDPAPGDEGSVATPLPGPDAEAATSASTAEVPDKSSADPEPDHPPAGSGSLTP